MLKKKVKDGDRREERERQRWGREKDLENVKDKTRYWIYIYQLFKNA